MSNPFQVVRDFEAAVCEYTGAPYCVTTNSCTMALLLALASFKQNGIYERVVEIEIPKRTYVSVPMSIMHAGYKVAFLDEIWLGAYQLRPLPVYDSARFFAGGMFRAFKADALKMVCVSFHQSKILGDSQGGAILHCSPGADAWLRRARFDGRTEGVAPKDDTFDMIGWHCYMSPDVAARLLWKLSKLPKDNPPLANDDYQDLSQMEIFR